MNGRQRWLIGGALALALVGAGDRGGSSGLGLSIVHAVAVSHGGSVTLHSPTSNGAGRQRGTRFEVTLPPSATADQGEPLRTARA